MGESLACCCPLKQRLAKFFKTRFWEPFFESVYQFTVVENLYLILESSCFFYFRKVFGFIGYAIFFKISESVFPVVDVSPRNQTVLEGREAVIKCVAKGAALSWTFENGELPPHAKSTNLLGQSILLLPRTSKWMEGWYTCRAKYTSGHAFSNSTLYVLGLFWCHHEVIIRRVTCLYM